MPFHSWSAAPSQTPEPGAQMQVVTGDALQVVRVELEPNMTYPFHSHPHEQMILVLMGEVEAQIEDDARVLGAGDIIHIPSGLEHRVRSLGEPVVTFEIFTPPRASLGHQDPT